MTSRFEVSLNGIPLSSLSSQILILDIKHSAPEINYETYSVAQRHGSRIWKRTVDSAQVTIDFAIREYSIQSRQEICNAVTKWAKNGGILQCNDRAGQRLRCVCTEFPYIGSSLSWTDTVSIVFTAYQVPFWESTMETIVELSSSGSWAESTVVVPGNIESSLVSVETAVGSSVTSLEFMVGSYDIKLSGLSFSGNSSVVISYDDRLIQSIRTGTTSLINKRTGSTDLLAACGESNTFKIKSNASATAKFKVRGLWL